MTSLESASKIIEKKSVLASLSKAHVTMFLLTALISLAVVFIVSHKTEESELQKLDITARNKLNVYLAFLQSEMKKYGLLTRILGHEEVVEDYFSGTNVGHNDQHLNSYLNTYNETIGGQFSFILSTEGKVLATSNWQTKDSLTGMDLSFRPYYLEAMKGKSSSYLAIGVKTKVPGLFFASPILIDGHIVGVAVIKFLPENLRLHWHIDNDHMFITDSSGVIFISSQAAAENMSFLLDQKRAARDEKIFRKYSDLEIRPLSYESRVVHDGHKILTMSTPFQTATDHDYVLLSDEITEFGWNIHVLSETHDIGLLQSIYSALSVATVMFCFLLGYYFYQRKTYLQKMYEFAIRDPLTGLFTRLYMNQKVPELLSKAGGGQKQELSVAIFDIDHFKSINDTHGHGVGDSALASVGAVILAEQSKNILGVRYGGEEFVLFMEYPLNKAEKVAETIRKKVEEMDIMTGGIRLKLTISSGVASYREDDSSVKLIERADKLLYIAKNSGRNLVVSEENQDRLSKSDVAG